MVKKAYSVIVDGTNGLRVFDANTGTTVRSLRLQDSIHSSPVVVNDRVTVIVQGSTGRRKGIIFTLPALSQVFSFPVA